MHAHHMLIHHVDQMGCSIAALGVIHDQLNLHVGAAKRARHKQNQRHSVS